MTQHFSFADLRTDQLTDAPQKLQLEYTHDGVQFATTIRICAFGIECPACGELVKAVRVHPAGRGLVCMECIERLARRLDDLRKRIDREI